MARECYEDMLHCQICWLLALDTQLHLSFQSFKQKIWYERIFAKSFGLYELLLCLRATVRTFEILGPLKK